MSSVSPSTGAVRFGLAIQAIDPPEEFVEVVRTAEQLDFDHLWVADSSLHGRCVYSYLTLAAVNSRRLRLGTAITHPVTRHPAINLNSLATLDEVSSGRAVLGIGAGDRPVLELGLRSASVRAIEDMVHLARKLFAGEKVTFEGRGFRTEAAALVQGGLPRQIPIYVAASGPKTLSMAGRVADGVLMQVGADADCIRYGLDRVTEGAEAAGRNPSAVDVVVVLYGAIREDRALARAESRPFAAWIPQTVPLYCEIAHIPEEDVQEVRRSYTGGELMKAHEAAQAVTDQMIDRFTLSGTPEDCFQRVEEILSIPRIRHVAFFVMGEDRFGTIRRFGEGVIAPLRSRSV
jgi:5,10-methylenetetrahydromethanopterin reductase